MPNEYRAFFHLHDDPFGETPNPRFFFEAAAHCAAVEGLLAGVRSGQGFSVLTGEVGTGKTLVTRVLLQALADTTESALVLYPRCSEAELLRTICEEFELGPGGASPKEDLDRINQYLLSNARAGRRTLLVIDESQNLPVATLETVRLLSNLETNERKLLHILLVGQPELNELLARPDLRQLKQRIGCSFELTPLSPGETAAYISYRLERSGGANFVRFDEAAFAQIHRLSGGIPREINRLSHELLGKAYARQVRLISGRFLKEVSTPARRSRWKFWARREAPRA